jgi:hypothetical protein
MRNWDLCSCPESGAARLRQLVDIVTVLLLRLDAEGRVVKRTKKVYTMILFGIINFTYTWYDPKGAIGPQEFADMAVDLFLHGFAPSAATKSAISHKRANV